MRGQVLQIAFLIFIHMLHSNQNHIHIFIFRIQTQTTTTKQTQSKRARYQQQALVGNSAMGIIYFTWIQNFSDLVLVGDNVWFEKILLRQWNLLFLLLEESCQFFFDNLRGELGNWLRDCQTLIGLCRRVSRLTIVNFDYVYFLSMWVFFSFSSILFWIRQFE